MKPMNASARQIFSFQPRVTYLPQHDRYLFAQTEPAHRLNIIGAGTMGQEHIAVTMLEGRATVHGVYDPNPGSVAAAQQTFRQFVPEGELEVYASLEEACKAPDVDGLIISTPNSSHLDVLKVAIASGKHILLEKPMATTVTDAYEMVKLAHSYEAVLQIGLQYRYKSIYVEAIHEVLQRVSLGDVHSLSMAEHRVPFLDKVKQWNKFSRYSGGTLVEKCCHYFDLLNLLAQSKPGRVFGSGSMAVNFKDFTYQQKASDILDNAIVTIDYENEVRACFQLCMFAPMFYEELVVCGAEGRLKASECQDFLDGPSVRSSLELTRGAYGPTKYMRPAYPALIEQSGHHGATFFEHEAFIDNIEGQTRKSASVEEGFWSIVVGAAAEESVKTGQPVMIQEMLNQYGIE